MNFFGPKKSGEKSRAKSPMDAPEDLAKQTPSYGIQDAILLMRTLPLDQNVELVVSVIKKTLESLSVDVPDLIEDATRRQIDLTNKVTSLQHRIADLERQIASHRDEIAQHEADYAETTIVKERLEMAEAVYQGLTTHIYTRPSI